ncbi:hypothetical protein E0H78_10740 [Acinetobacter sp. ANC 4641]|nr:hypothetical protein E0H78_10740 [Acinetobacter sp. ANC 4641]
MCLTNNCANPKICHVKTMVYKPCQVNEGNDKKPCSPARSPSNTLNLKVIHVAGERENNFSRAYVGNYFLSLLILNFLYSHSVFIFFALTRARIFMFTRSLLIKKYIKTNVYQVNEQVNDCFSRSPNSPVVHLRVV